MMRRPAFLTVPLFWLASAIAVTPEHLPALTRESGDGDYSIKPPYAPAPEQTPRPGVPKGRVVRFSMRLEGSRFYPNRGLTGTTPSRAVTVYIPSGYVPGTPAPLLLAHDA